MKTAVSFAAMMLVTIVAAGAGPRPGAPVYRQGLTDNAWWGAPSRRAAAAPSLYSNGLPHAQNKRAPFAASISANGQGTN